VVGDLANSFTAGAEKNDDLFALFAGPTKMDTTRRYCVLAAVVVSRARNPPTWQDDGIATG